jgi:hypothetical protein
MFMSLPKKGLCGLFLSIVLLPHLARATTVVEQTFPDLVHQAEEITVGTVTGIQEQWDATRQAPITHVTFSRLTVLKGDSGRETLTLEFLGGHTPDGRVVAVAGMPRFTVGEKTVVFSAGNRRALCPLVGVWQGLLRVAFDPRRGEETVSDNFRVPIVGMQKGRFQKRTPASPPREALSLPAVKELITQEMRGSYGWR